MGAWERVGSVPWACGAGGQWQRGMVAVSPLLGPSRAQSLWWGSWGKTTTLTFGCWG